MKVFRLFSLALLATACSNIAPETFVSMYYKDTLNVVNLVGFCDFVWVNNNSISIKDNAAINLRNLNY